MKDDVYTNVKPTLCDVCGMVHRTYEDGFSYLDCMIYYRNNIESKEVKEARHTLLTHLFMTLQVSDLLEGISMILD